MAKRRASRAIPSSSDPPPERTHRASRWRYTPAPRPAHAARHPRPERPRCRRPGASGSAPRRCAWRRWSPAQDEAVCREGPHERSSARRGPSMPAHAIRCYSPTDAAAARRIARKPARAASARNQRCQGPSRTAEGLSTPALNDAPRNRAALRCAALRTTRGHAVAF